MGYAAVKPAQDGAALGKVFVILCALLLSACGTAGSERMSLAPPPPAMTFSPDGDTASNDVTLASANTLQYIEPSTSLASDPVLGVAGCKIKDRFDRSAAIAYHFSDNKSRIALNMGLDGTNVNRAMLRFTYKFQPIKSKKEKCLYPSRVQGVIGSAYNELVARKDNTVWQALHATIQKFTDR
jgi:hypothetical protein